MKHECDVVRDLMPSYIDDTASEKTKHMVDEHIGECAECENVYREMRRDAQMDVPVQHQNPAFTGMVKRMRKQRKRRSVMGVLWGLLIALVLFLACAAGYYWRFEDMQMVQVDRISFHKTDGEGLALAHISGVPEGGRVCIAVQATDRDGDGEYIYEAAISVWATRAQIHRGNKESAYYILGTARDDRIYIRQPTTDATAMISRILYGTHENGGKIIYMEDTGLQHVALFGLTIKSPASVIFHSVAQSQPTGWTPNVTVIETNDTSNVNLITMPTVGLDAAPTDTPHSTEEIAKL